MIQRDYIMRMIYMLTDVLLRVFKLKEQKEYDVALDEIGKTIEELFAAEASLLKVVDPMTAAQLLGHWQKVKILATLYREQGEIYAQQQNIQAALAKLEQSAVLYGEAVKLKGVPDNECSEAQNSITELISQLN